MRISAIVPVIAALLPSPTAAFVGTSSANSNHCVIVGTSPYNSPLHISTRRWRRDGDRCLVGAVWAHADDNEIKNDDEYDGFRNESSNIDDGLKNLMKDTNDLAVGDWIVAKRDIPSMGIRAGAGYKLQAIFLKGANPEGLGVEVLPLERYGDDGGNSVSSSYTKYLKVYNPRDHGKSTEQGVVVTPEEIGLTSIRADWTEAALLAIPGFFWVFVAMAFSNYYTDRYGGNFLDAFFRT